MNHIEILYIEGFKKFEKIEVEFNECMNILVGENESGKSTILEAISLVLNQYYRNADKSFLKDLFNRNQIEEFKNAPSISKLPYIYIELKLNLDKKGKNSEYFWGQNNKEKEEAFGITFESKFNEELGAELDTEISEGKIPYEYYDLRWKTFAGLPYITVKKPFGFISIDTSNTGAESSYNYYNRTLFNNTYNEETRLKIKNTFRENLNDVLDDIDLEKIDDNREFGINDKKVILERIISVYDNGIPLENKGSGMESFIKMKIALNKSKSNLDVILIEEPENHLCFANMNKMIKEISNKQNDSQIILTTHNNMIASRLNLNNVIWFNNCEGISLKSVDDKVAKFFVKNDDNGFLQLLLSEKIILVEGATEYLLLPNIYKKVCGKTLEEDKISVISCKGISYKNYLKIGEKSNKKIAVITDNDREQKNIDMMKKFNNLESSQHIFMDDNLDNWTWEVCIYNLNKKRLDEVICLQTNAKYLVHGEDVGSKTLGKMLNNKVETAYEIIINNIELEVPQYVKDAILWLNE